MTGVGSIAVTAQVVACFWLLSKNVLTQCCATSRKGMHSAGPTQGLRWCDIEISWAARLSLMYTPCDTMPRRCSRSGGRRRIERPYELGSPPRPVAHGGPARQQHSGWTLCAWQSSPRPAHNAYAGPCTTVAKAWTRRPAPTHLLKLASLGLRAAALIHASISRSCRRPPAVCCRSALRAASTSRAASCRSCSACASAAACNKRSRAAVNRQQLPDRQEFFWQSAQLKHCATWI